MSEPKKPRRSKAKKLNLSIKKHWQDIVNGVDKDELPINILQHIVVQLIDGTDVSIDIKRMLEDGTPSDEIEELLDAKFRDLDEYIDNVDFFIDIDKVVANVHPATELVLKNL